MTRRRRVVFVINLIQDVSILRPLIFISARDLDLSVEVILTHYFTGLDRDGFWRQEIVEICRAAEVPVVVVDNEREALQVLQGVGGVLIAASESDVPSHAVTHNLFRFAPTNFVKITLQHGFECLGFLHNRAHDRAYGRVTFAADLVCGWCDGSRLTSMTPSQRAKLYLSGPPSLLQSWTLHRDRTDVGLICENMHSVRFSRDGDSRNEFVTVFRDFCTVLAGDKRSVQLRPHPAGQFILRNEVELPSNVTVNNNPIYKVNLEQFAYGISAPSSVLLDLVLAGVPVAVWKDGSGTMDTTNYNGLTEVSSLREWVEFSRDAVASPAVFIDRQRAFIERMMIPTDPGEVHRRFVSLIDSAARSGVSRESSRSAPERILFIANSILPTLQICFIKPLASMVESGRIITEYITEEQMNREFGDQANRDEFAVQWIDKQIALFKPTILVFCRYSGPYAAHLVRRARTAGVPVVFHIDDDLLGVPVALGRKKFEYHNDPNRKRTIRFLLGHSDLVYCSTEALKVRLESLGAAAPVVAGKINCSGTVMVTAVERPVRKLGYMASADHAHNLDMVLPAIVEIMRRVPEVQFALFGSIPKPASLEEFGDRVTMTPPVQEYDEFLNQFAKSDWDIGICPLAPTAFNQYKGNNKWIEYTSIGAAVIASADTVYDECCSEGCGILVRTLDEWSAALEALIRDPGERYAQVVRAQRKLSEQYSTNQLREQVLDILKQATLDVDRRLHLAIA